MVGFYFWVFDISVEQFGVLKQGSLLILHFLFGFLGKRPFSKSIGYWSFGDLLNLLQKYAIGPFDLCIFLLFYHILLLFIEAHLGVIIMLAKQSLLEHLSLLLQRKPNLPIIVLNLPWVWTLSEGRLLVSLEKFPLHSYIANKIWRTHIILIHHIKAQNRYLTGNLVISLGKNSAKNTAKSYY